MKVTKKGKKYLINRMVYFIPQLFQKKKHIIFNAPVNFHAQHLAPLIEKFINDGTIIIHLVGHFEPKYAGENIVRHKSIKDLPNHIRYSVFLTTEFEVLWWLNTINIFFGHGVGPKLNYQNNSILEAFDYSYAPCSAIYNSQIKHGIQVVKTGLPILEKSHVDELGVQLYFNTSSDKPLLIYAPSWNADSSQISDISKIIQKLSRLEGYDIIVSPHPNLLNEKRFSDTAIFEDIAFKINSPKTHISSLDLCRYADVVISDISSVLFEALALNKCVIHDGNKKVYEESGAIEVLNSLLNEIMSLNIEQDFEEQLLIARQKHQAIPTTQFIGEYIYNINSAVKICERHIRTIL